MDTQSTYISQNALYSAAGGGEEEGGEAKPVAPSLQASRSFFIIDKSRMVGERDTVEDAKVVYLPDSEFKKDVYHSRCSCLVGVADVYRNMTGEFPQTLSMAGCYYACQLLEPNYFMFLLGRPLEPEERVRATLQHISDIFHFYYHSPEAVMTTCHKDWLTFTANMMFIFSRIREYVFRDPHSISFMFHTLPYNQNGPKRKRARLFLQASHVLRSCQEQEPIVGGCIMYNTEIVCNQLSPRIMEKLQVVGGKGIDLNTKSILAENVAPETVWVLEVYLSPEETEDLTDIQRDITSHRRAYEGLTPNTSLIDSPVSFLSRFQSGAGHTGTGISSSTSSTRGVPTRSGWRVGRSTGGRRSRPRVVEPNPDVDQDYYNLSVAFSSLSTQQRRTEGSGRSAAKHEDVAVFNANKSTITVLPQVTQTPSTSPQVSKGRGRGEPGGGGGGERARLNSDRKMPRLHGNSGKRDLTRRPYDDPDTFPEAVASPVATKTESETGKPQENSVSDVVPSPAATSVPSPAATSVPSPAATSVPSPAAASIPASLSIPIPAAGHSTNGAHSPLPAGPGGSSSLEDERFATPSPNFSLIVSAAPGKSGSDLPGPAQQTVDPGYGADHSHSFQTADELSDKSNSPPPPLPERLGEQPDSSKTDEKVSSIYDTMMPLPTQPRWTVLQKQEERRRRFEDSDDFVDSEVVDQLVSESRLMVQQEAISRPKQASHTGWEQDHDPPPALPPRNRKIYDNPASGLPPPKNLPLPTASLVEVEQLEGNSGEFTVVDLSPPAVPQRKNPPLNQGRGGTELEVSRVESTPPPSPPPRTHSRRGNRSLENTPQEDQGSIGERPPTPPPKDHETTEEGELMETEVIKNAVERDGDLPEQSQRKTTEEGEVVATEVVANAVERDGSTSDLPAERSQSSSPDYQHRGLTQSLDVGSSLEDGGGDGHLSSDQETVRESVQVIERQGWLGGAGERGRDGEDGISEQAEEDSSQQRRNTSSSVDPVKRVDSQLAGSPRDESSSVKILTSDEEEEEEEEGSDGDTTRTVTLGYQRHPSTSTPRETCTRAARLEGRGAALESLSIQNLSVTPGGRGAPPSLSFTQLNTPEMTLQLSMAERLRGTADDRGQSDMGGGGEGGVRSQVAMVASDIAWIHQTLSRSGQPPAAQPAPPLETWCIYVQRQSNTLIVLLAKSGLHNNHSLLTQLWKRLLPQLFALDQGLETLQEHNTGRHNYNLAVFNNSDKYCAVESRKALYKFRHAVRQTHLEYQSNPDLCQVTLLNAPKMASQSVMGREVFYHHQRGTPGDVFNSTAIVTRTARHTPHPPLSGETPAHFL